MRQAYALAGLLEMAGMSRSSFYYYRKALLREDKYVKEREEIQKIYRENKGRYGYRRITLELRKRGYGMNHKTVLRLMREAGLKSVVRRRKHRGYFGWESHIAPNLLNRQFDAGSPGEKWVTDITEISIHGKRLYLSAILDLYNREIVSYSIGEKMSMKLVREMLQKAEERIRGSAGLLLHSDQGWHYRMPGYRQWLGERGMIQSMSRKGNCLDNAVIENFFGILKTELTYPFQFDSPAHFIRELDDYILYYNTKRIKAKLKGLSPVEFRTQAAYIA